MSSPLSPKQPLVIIGAGGHGQVLADLALRDGFTVEGFVDQAIETGSMVMGIPILGTDSFLETANHDHFQLLMGVGLTIGLDRRLSLAEQFQEKGWRFSSLASESAIVSQRSKISVDGVQILAGAIIQRGSQIHAHSVINTGAIIEHDVKIGEGSFIGPGAVLNGGVEVGSRVLIGSGAILLPGVTVGNDAVVGGGSLVNKSVKSNTVVVGNPARAIGESHGE